MFNVNTGVEYTPGDLNPILARYTSEAFRLTPFPIDQISTITGIQGLRNGDAPPSIYSLFGNVGNYGTGYGYSLDEQYAVSADASFDIKAKRLTHSVEIGLYYQQRTERNYSLSFNSTRANTSLWQLMRQLSGSLVDNIDRSTPSFIIGGVTYDQSAVENGLIAPGLNDTIIYGLQYDPTRQNGTFNYNLREKLGMDPKGTEYVQTDNLDPSFYSLGMFSADELLNNGKELVSYYGYDYKGNLQTGQVNFNDFFTAKDEYGNFTRPIAAFRPNYIAGYISDFIQFKDFKMTLGLRAERFDANTKVLKDPYSLYATRTVSDVTANQNRLNGGAHPGNIGNDYVVYVGDNSSKSPDIIGYRTGDVWYDPFGKEVVDPTSLKAYSDGRDPQPYLQDTSRINSPNYDPNTSFQDYKPQVNVMPRVNFSFPIGERAYFYAHYDVVVQRPTSGYQATPIDYLYLTQRSGLIGNPDLKPERTIDYEMGFQQALNSNSAITLSGFYKERKDMIQQRSYLYAFPITYKTYGNRDFSTTKGLTLNYDLRRTSHIQMNVAYTLQFAQGTGSDANSAQNLLSNFIAARVPNLRATFPLNYDSRHIIVINADYRLSEGEGPKIGGKSIFENAGLNMVFRTEAVNPTQFMLMPKTYSVVETATTLKRA